MTTITSRRAAAACAFCLTILAAGAAAQDYDAAAAIKTFPPPAATREVYIVTVHLDGNTSTKAEAGHPAEPFPDATLTAGGGLGLTAPDQDGHWRVRAFVFEPAQIIVRAGETVGLNFVGVQGPSHRIAVEGVDGVVELRRGEVRRVEVHAEKPGTVRFASLDRQPSMRGELVVLPPG